LLGSWLVALIGMIFVSQLPLTYSMKPTLLHRLPIVIGLLLTASHLAAQTAPNPPAPTATSSDESNSEVITLGTFDVSGTNNHSYSSDETTTGTRIKTNLRDLPFAVSTITSDFISDFASFEFNDQVSNVSSLSISEVQGQYQLRGFVVTSQLVDGFRRIGLIDPVNIDRIDVIKGPAASVYGYIQPGGVVNITTKKPLTHQKDSISISAGDYDFFRTEAFSTGPVGNSDKLFYRVEGSDEHRDFQQAFKVRSRYYGAFQLLYKPDADTSLTFKIDNVFQHENRGTQLLYTKLSGVVLDPYRVFTSGANTGKPQTISNYYTGLLYGNNPYNSALYNFNSSGPEDYNDRRMTTATATAEHRINDIFSIREGFNYFSRAYIRTYVDGLNYFPQSTQGIGGTGTIGQFANPQQPEHDDDPTRNVANQVDLTAKFNTGPVSNQMLLTLDYSYEMDRTKELRMDTFNAGSNPVAFIDPANPNWNFITYQQNPSLYDQPQANYWDSVNDYGVFMNEHASMLENRLNAIAGLRVDWVNTKLDDYSVFTGTNNYYQEQDFVQNIRHHPTYQLGLSYRVIDPVTLFVNDSTSINPQTNYIPGTGQASPNSTSKGYEYGTKVSMLQNSLIFTASHYDIYQYNALYQTTGTTDTFNAAAGGAVQSTLNSFVLIPLQVSIGDEFDLAWSATRNLNLQLDYSYDDSRIRQSSPYWAFLVGAPTRRVPDDQFGALARYEFKDGFLKGLFLTVKENYVSKASVNIGGRTASGSGFVNNPLPNGKFPFDVYGVPHYAVVPTALTTRTITGTSDNDATLVRLPDGRVSIYNEPYATTDLGIGYSFKTGKFGHKVQLNVKNIFNRAYTYGSAILGDPITYVATYTLTF
jgi:iron complex outermembrane receptor protein